jgi:signal peptidase I
MGVRDKKWWVSEITSLAVVLAAVTAARSSLADHYYVPSGSMEYSLMPGDRVVVNKMAYGFRIPLTKIDILGSSTPARGEIAVFDRTVEHFGERDALLNLSSGTTYNQGGGPNFDAIVPQGMVLAMGDHRGNSNDGRKFGFIDERELFGRAVAIYYRRGDGFTWKSL